MPTKSKVPQKNKYAETIKSRENFAGKQKKQIVDEESEDELEEGEVKLDDKEPVQDNKPKPTLPELTQVEQEEPEQEEEKAEKTTKKEVKESKRKYVKKPKELMAGPVETAQYNSVLDKVNEMANLFIKLQEDQARLNTIVEKTVKATNAEQHKKLDNTLQESREFFARLAR